MQFATNVPNLPFIPKLTNIVFMRFVRYICEEHVLTPRESANMGLFFIFADSLRQGNDVYYTKQQIDNFLPPHLHHLGWYLEKIPDVEDYINASDWNIYDGVFVWDKEG